MNIKTKEPKMMPVRSSHMLLIETVSGFLGELQGQILDGSAVSIDTVRNLANTASTLAVVCEEYVDDNTKTIPPTAVGGKEGLDFLSHVFGLSPDISRGVADAMGMGSPEESGVASGGTGHKHDPSCPTPDECDKADRCLGLPPEAQIVRIFKVNKDGLVGPVLSPTMQAEVDNIMGGREMGLTSVHDALLALVKKRSESMLDQTLDPVASIMGRLLTPMLARIFGDPEATFTMEHLEKARLTVATIRGKMVDEIPSLFASAPDSTLAKNSDPERTKQYFENVLNGIDQRMVAMTNDGVKVRDVIDYLSTSLKTSFSLDAIHAGTSKTVLHH